jgi:hypothetical protein
MPSNKLTKPADVLLFMMLIQCKRRHAVGGELLGMVCNGEREKCPCSG